MSYRLKLRHLVLLFGFALLTPFQNCADSGTPDTSTGSSQQNYESQLPMAYKSTIDTIGYMSCSNITEPVEKRTYFSFRAGAYNQSTGGIEVTPDFLNATKNYSLQQRALALDNSSINSGTRLSLSIRQRANFQSMWTADTIQIGEEIDSFLPPLSSEEVAGPLMSVATGAKVNYFPGKADKRVMEASLRFFKHENVAAQTRNDLDAQSTMLTVGYSHSADELEQRLRSPADFDSSSSTPNTSQVYGMGYLLGFSLPKNYQSGVRRVLSAAGVQEIELLTKKQTAGAWDCGTGNQFMIIRPEDWAANNNLCNLTVDRLPASAADQASLEAIRRVLPVSDWFVDMDKRCVVPKRTGDYCYGSAIGTRTVQYGVANCVDSNTTLCPHFVSVCVRK